MASLKEMTSIKPKVAALIKIKEELRDNDNKLLANFWSTEIDYKAMSGEEVFKAIADGELTSPESIARMKRKLQAQFPQLRGKEYDNRRKEESVVKKGINKQL